MTIVKVDLGMPGGSFIGVTYRRPNSRSRGAENAAIQTYSALNASDEAFLSRMIRIGMERQANSTVSLDDKG